ncbi:PD-(D/E)XK nuclease family protein [Candidatus Woesearchaeota archaeon]|nr:PD-(D/E)XK nuclease family protein [Candidatus Woesearchaeota archaeon]
MSEIIWSPSRLKVAESCMAKYYYMYIKPETSTSTAEMAMGDLFHRLMQEFYKESGEPKYKSAEAFANTAVARWQFMIRQEATKGRKIVWGYKAEPYVFKNKIIPETGNIIYNTYQNRIPPVENEFGFNVEIDGIHYRGFIDAIFPFSEQTGKVAVADFKTHRVEPRKEKLRTDHQFTVYHLIVGFLLKNNLELRRKVGIPDDLAEIVGIDGVYMSPHIEMQWHQLRNGNIIPTERTDKDYPWLVRSIEDRVEQIEKQNFSRHPGYDCNFCPVKRKCDGDLKSRIKLEIPESPQIEIFPTPEKKKKGLRKHQYKLKL